jgi:hypothetical protein
MSQGAYQTLHASAASQSARVSPVPASAQSSAARAPAHDVRVTRGDGSQELRTVVVRAT